MLELVDRVPVLLRYSVGTTSLEATPVKAVIVDAVRLLVYGTTVLADHLAQSQTLLTPVIVASLVAFMGAFVGKKFLRKVTLRTVQLMVAGAVLTITLGMN